VAFYPQFSKSSYVWKKKRDLKHIYQSNLLVDQRRNLTRINLVFHFSHFSGILEINSKRFQICTESKDIMLTHGNRSCCFRKSISKSF
jgi:hypothetical protein